MDVLDMKRGRRRYVPASPAAAVDSLQNRPKCQTEFLRPGGPAPRAPLENPVQAAFFRGYKKFIRSAEALDKGFGILRASTTGRRLCLTRKSKMR